MFSQHNPEWGFPLDALNPKGGKPITPRSKERTLRTPNLERFAKQGLRATMSYAPSSVCGPSRSAIFSERHVGLTQTRSNYKIEQVETIGSNLAAELKTALGYRTAYFGKWGLGRIHGPWTQGFDNFLGYLSHSDAHYAFPDFLHYYNASITRPTSNKDLQNLRYPLPGNIGKTYTESNCAMNKQSTCIYANDVFRDKTLKFISNPANQPFFVIWAPTYPHSGYYSKGSKQSSPVRRITPGREKMTGHESIRGHASQIEMHFDRDIGALLDILEANPSLDSNTFIVVTSDNGPHQDADGYHVSDFQASGGLRGIKRRMFDGGLRVPTMVRQKGVIPEGAVSRVPHALYDLFPTFRQVAGLPPRTTLPGLDAGYDSGARSMYSVWKSNDESMAPNRAWLYFELCPSKRFHDSDCNMAIIDIRTWRSGPVAKLVVTNEGKSKMLFDLRQSPNETRQWGNVDIAQELWSWQKKIRMPLAWKQIELRIG